MQSSYAFTLRCLPAQLVNGTYVNTSSLLHTAIGQGGQGWPLWHFSFQDDVTFSTQVVNTKSYLPSTNSSPIILKGIYSEGKIGVVSFSSFWVDWNLFRFITWVACIDSHTKELLLWNQQIFCIWKETPLGRWYNSEMTWKSSFCGKDVSKERNRWTKWTTSISLSCFLGPLVVAQLYLYLWKRSKEINQGSVSCQEYVV